LIFMIYEPQASVHLYGKGSGAERMRWAPICSGWWLAVGVPTLM
jgi:hypothetical protein